ncbi:hypothetical protein [Deinococcus roseus]|uniref:Uncharacterized protein n=1 Tax=Deinococcus roseus TaxID=392414 RepID=A0ABQ2D3P6_9DEIO|nr:hypothetical protein [Deinococcus roseus]GGJ43487.1 hypothetical protein GCM10008938_32180 [Deinococcus roseus]
MSKIQTFNPKWSLLCLVAGGLVSCSNLAGALIPPQTLQDNPLGINQTAIQTRPGNILDYTAAPFGDYVAQSPAPNTVEVGIVISKVTVNASCLTLPASFSVTLRDIKVQVRDQSDTFAQKATIKGTTENPITVTASNKVLRPELSVYAYALAAPKTIKIIYDRQLYNIVTSGGANVARLTGTLEIADPNLVGCRVGALVDSNYVKLSNFG